MSRDADDSFEDACVDAAAETEVADGHRTFDPSVLVDVNVFARIGCERIDKMLTTLADVFPENMALQMFLAYFQANVLGEGLKEQELIQEWYDQMTGGPVDLIEATKARDAETLLNADVEFLKRIGAREMYDDPDVPDEDREEIMKFVQLINEAALVFVHMPAEFRELMTTVLLRLDTSQPFSMQTVFSAMAGTLRGFMDGPTKDGDGDGDGDDDSDADDVVDNVDATDRLMGLASQLMNLTQLVGVEAILRMVDGAKLVEVTGCENMAELTMQLKEEAVKCFDLSALPEGVMDAAMPILNSIGGSK